MLNVFLQGKSCEDYVKNSLQALLLIDRVVQQRQHVKKLQNHYLQIVLEWHKNDFALPVLWYWRLNGAALSIAGRAVLSVL